MKFLIFILLFIPSTLSAQLSINFGDSESKGLLGASIQVNHFSLSCGWKPRQVAPFSYPVNEDWKHCYSLALTYLFNKQGSTPYISLGAVDKGRSEYNKVIDKWEVFPAYFLSGGLRFLPSEVARRFPKRIFFEIGGGFKYSQIATEFTFDFLINFMITK